MMESILEKLLNKELPSDTEILYLLYEYYKKHPSEYKLKYYMPTPVVTDPNVTIVDYLNQPIFNPYSGGMSEEQISRLREYCSPLRFG